MRILRTLESFYPYISGPANQAFKISDELERRGISSPILTTFYGAPHSNANEKIGRVHVHRYRHHIGFMKYLYSPSMRLAMKDFDIIHTHNYRSYQAEISYLAAKRKGRPFIISTHGSLVGYKSFVRGMSQTPYIVYDIFGRTVVDNADAVIVSSKMEYGEAREFGVTKDRLHIIPMGIDIADYPSVQRTWKGTRLLFVGRISRDRRLEPVIRSLLHMPKDVTLDIVGKEVKRSATSRSGYLQELRSLVKRLGLTHRIRFTGELSGAALRKKYSSSDIFVYASEWENFGQSILEAQAAGLPVISTKVGIAPEIIQSGKTGFIVQPDADEIAKKALHLISDPIDHNLIRERISSRFSWDKVMKKYLSLYERL